MYNKIICWWSGGVTSAIACLFTIQVYGKENCRVIFIDTCNEHPDTYRFFIDCEKLFGLKIEIITGIKDYVPKIESYKNIFLDRALYFQPNKNTHYKSIVDVWEWYASLNVSFGAVCSTDLKRGVREKWQLENTYTHQVFGFEFDKKEFNRAMAMKLNHPKANPIFPLLMYGFDKKDCIETLNLLGVKIPQAYKDGLRNNNCLGSEYGCVQGGIGYWQMIHRTDPAMYFRRARLEHLLTDKAGHQVTMCKDQSNDAKKLENKKDALLFLLPHPDYPQNKTVLDVKAREPKPMVDCSGFCGTFDLSKRNPVEKEINY
ncbi:hypothetical protein P2559Y_0051 [Croceibacter phage P2559Y]|uniref:phosphoadenosine phosphosulfate reductase n=1 Tax=Croceibacter phage P2559Y TaxID=1327037 RepID=UPI0003F4A8DB|nr:phosphoadenosine phosphosulfate reductase [Croceibacter phage P2559Y]AGM14114.1 hypothetical protein P2559Y_0051 [Croceibacter phage P2559Y]